MPQVHLQTNNPPTKHTKPSISDDSVDLAYEFVVPQAEHQPRENVRTEHYLIGPNPSPA